MKKTQQLYEGKAKKVYATDVEGIYIVDYKERWNNRMVLSLLFIGFIVIKFYKCTDKKDKQIKYPCLFARTGKYD